MCVLCDTSPFVLEVLDWCLTVFSLSASSFLDDIDDPDSLLALSIAKISELKNTKNIFIFHSKSKAKQAAEHFKI